ncbi:hypothetical protein D3C85_996610 [compost metagenome]
MWREGARGEAASVASSFQLAAWMRRALQSALTVRNTAAMMAAVATPMHWATCVSMKDTTSAVWVSCSAMVPRKPNSIAMALPVLAGRAMKMPSTKAVGSIARASISKEWMAGMMPSRYRADSGIEYTVYVRNCMMPGTGLSCDAKKQLKMAAISAAVAPLLQAVPIQNAQHTEMATPAASADSSAMPWSRCSAALGSRAAWALCDEAFRGAPARPAWISRRSARHSS